MIYIFPFVNTTSAYVNFRKATDGLFGRVAHEDLAKALGVSVATIRQARLKRNAHARRAAPGNWEDAVLRLAEDRVWHYRQLIEEIRNRSRHNGRKNVSRDR